MESSSKLDQKIIEVFEYVRNPPPNESTTCEWVIYPLLLAIGYIHRDIISRFADNNGQYPDYAILPNSDHAWFLEAKSWSQPLSDSHAQQSLNYANQNGRRWVVLSNGHEWRLYDNRIQGLAAQKLVVCAGLAEISRLKQMLMALGKDAVSSSSLEPYARTTRLAEALSEQLASPESNIVRAIWGVVQGLPGLEDGTCAEIVSCLSQFTSHPPPAVGRPPIPVREPAQEDQPPTSDSSSPTPTLQSLKGAGEPAVSGKKPATLTCPNGVLVEVQSWTALGIETVKWLAESSRLPHLPYRGRTRGKLNLLDTSPPRSGVKELRFKKLTYDGGTLYIHINRSARDWIMCLSELCEAAGTDPREFSIELKS